MSAASARLLGDVAAWWDRQGDSVRAAAFHERIASEYEGIATRLNRTAVEPR